MSYFQLYLLTTLIPNSGILAVILIIFSIVGSIFFLFLYADNGGYDKDIEKNALKGVKTSITILVISMLAIVAIPSKEQLMLIIGGKYITNNEELTKMPDNLYKWINSELESKIKDNN